MSRPVRDYDEREFDPRTAEELQKWAEEAEAEVRLSAANLIRSGRRWAAIRDRLMPRRMWTDFLATQTEAPVRSVYRYIRCWEVFGRREAEFEGFPAAVLSEIVLPQEDPHWAANELLALWHRVGRRGLNPTAAMEHLRLCRERTRQPSAS